MEIYFLAVVGGVGGGVVRNSERGGLSRVVGCVCVAFCMLCVLYGGVVWARFGDAVKSGRHELKCFI